MKTHPSPYTAQQEHLHPLDRCLVSLSQQLYSSTVCVSPTNLCKTIAVIKAPLSQSLALGLSHSSSPLCSRPHMVAVLEDMGRGQGKQCSSKVKDISRTWKHRHTALSLTVCTFFKSRHFPAKLQLRFPVDIAVFEAGNVHTLLAQFGADNKTGERDRTSVAWAAAWLDYSTLWWWKDDSFWLYSDTLKPVTLQSPECAENRRTAKPCLDHMLMHCKPSLLLNLHEH